jgi:hypothetical protein
MREWRAHDSKLGLQAQRIVQVMEWISTEQVTRAEFPGVCHRYVVMSSKGARAK